MFFNWDEYEFYLKPGVTDMRIGRTGLLNKVVNEMEKDPFSKKAFLFCGRNRHLLKVFIWDANGFWIMTKYLEEGTFSWPKDEKEALRLTVDDVKRLLTGQDIFRKLPHLESGVLF